MEFFLTEEGLPGAVWEVGVEVEVLVWYLQGTVRRGVGQPQEHRLRRIVIVDKVQGTPGDQISGIHWKVTTRMLERALGTLS